MISDCSEDLQWFLSQLEIDQEAISQLQERTDEEIEEDNKEPDNNTR
jgi:hypothetical protein